MVWLLLFVATFSASAQDMEDPAVVARRDAHLQKHFSRFVPLEFEKGTNGFARIHQLSLQSTNNFEFEDYTYCGFRFIVPSWIDGDFDWMFFFAQSGEGREFLPPPEFQWFIVPRQGTNAGFKGFFRSDFKVYPALQKEFPRNSLLGRQLMARSDLKAGEEYAIWFRFLPTQKINDVRFAMTISSPRGEREMGALPTR
jgi:hypothetical protein